MICPTFDPPFDPFVARPGIVTDSVFVAGVSDDDDPNGDGDPIVNCGFWSDNNWKLEAVAEDDVSETNSGSNLKLDILEWRTRTCLNTRG